MELTVGKKTNKMLAEWFGVTPNSFSRDKINKLEELKYFAEFYEEKGKVIITKVLNPIYQKNGSKTYQKVKDKIDEVWSKDGLDTCTRVGAEIYEILYNEDSSFDKALSTVEAYTRKGKNELYGTAFSPVGGTLGNCIYMWCKRDKDTGKYSFLTEEEKEIKEKLQMKYFGDATEKQVIVKGMVEMGEITEAEAWGVLTKLTNMGNHNFMAFLKELQDKIGCQVIRGTMVERKVNFDAIAEKSEVV